MARNQPLRLNGIRINEVVIEDLQAAQLQVEIWTREQTRPKKLGACWRNNIFEDAKQEAATSKPICKLSGLLSPRMASFGATYRNDPTSTKRLGGGHY